jgi:hypothetical protein
MPFSLFGVFIFIKLQYILVYSIFLIINFYSYTFEIV